MRFFPLIDFQYWVLSFFLGIVIVILIYVGWSGYPRRKESGVEETRPVEADEEDGGRKDEKNPIAPFLIFVYIGIAVWAAAYMVYTGIIKGVSF